MRMSTQTWNHSGNKSNNPNMKLRQTRTISLPLLVVLLVCLASWRIPVTDAQLRGGLGNGVPQSSSDQAIMVDPTMPGDPVTSLPKKLTLRHRVFDLDSQQEHDMDRTARSRTLPTTTNNNNNNSAGGGAENTVDFTVTAAMDKPNASPEI